MQHINGAPFRVLPTVGRAFVTGSFLQEALESPDTEMVKRLKYTKDVVQSMIIGWSQKKR